ncbi:GTPase-associated system all-helical protein GASH [Rhizobium leguminosarum]|uniref:GTPase-associated system all-helical protein GASH n=1 Tax=Rhizobium leguminosarum TaxID=384 RepID=UPI001F2BB914|nr:GTPase-associated system all-helical protein GASH [Rhizobium leguminosarum]UIJ82419.1 hypothetical protein LZK78_24790 [Rhizobium leguminosarum]
MPAFNFVAEYRDMQPAAERDIIAARDKAFTKAKADANKLIGRIVDLAYFAYRVPLPAESDANKWFGDILSADDPAFSIQHDVEEAARIATLVLRERLGNSFWGTPVLVHAAAFAGKRQTADNHALSRASRDALRDLVRKRGFALKRTEVSPGKAAPVGDLITKYDSEGDETTEKQVLQAIVQDYDSQIKHLTKSSNEAIEAVFAENRRLAEEVDLLWWHLGGHSYLLDMPLEQVPDALKPIVIGMDVGDMVNALPGPYGSYGIIRKALGSKADVPMKLSEAFKVLTPEHGLLVAKKPNRYALAPIHGAASDVLLSGEPVSGLQFKRNTGLSFDIKLTAYELAVQAYHERVLSKLDWI